MSIKMWRDVFVQGHNVRFYDIMLGEQRCKNWGSDVKKRDIVTEHMMHDVFIICMVVVDISVQFNHH